MSISTGTPTNITVDTGMIVTIYCPVTGLDTPTIGWFKDGVMFTTGGRIRISTTTLPGADITSVVTIDGFEPSDAGTYQCTGTNVAGIDFREVSIQCS